MLGLLLLIFIYGLSDKSACDRWVGILAATLFGDQGNAFSRLTVGLILKEAWCLRLSRRRSAAS